MEAVGGRPGFGGAPGGPRRAEDDASLVDFIKVRARPAGTRGPAPACRRAAAAPPVHAPRACRGVPGPTRAAARLQPLLSSPTTLEQPPGAAAAGSRPPSAARGAAAGVAPAPSGPPPAGAPRKPRPARARPATVHHCSPPAPGLPHPPRSRPRRSRGTTAPRSRGMRATTATCRCWPPARPPSTAPSRRAPAAGPAVGVLESNLPCCESAAPLLLAELPAGVPPGDQPSAAGGGRRAAAAVEAEGRGSLPLPPADQSCCRPSSCCRRWPSRGGCWRRTAWSCLCSRPSGIGAPGAGGMRGAEGSCGGELSWRLEEDGLQPASRDGRAWPPAAARGAQAGPRSFRAAGADPWRAPEVMHLFMPLPLLIYAHRSTASSLVLPVTPKSSTRQSKPFIEP